MFETFDIEKAHEVESYFKRYDLFCKVQKTAEDMKVPLLLASIGGEAFGKLEDLVTPNEVTECTYQDIRKALTDHFKPKPLTAMERHKFRERIQEDGETFSEYVAALKKLSKDCGYQTNERLEEELIDQIIRGIREERTRNYFLSTADLTYDQVIKKALADEKAKATTNVFKSGHNESEVSKVNFRDIKKTFGKSVQREKKTNYNRDKTVQSKQKTCFRCGGDGHIRENCRIDPMVKYFNCKRNGHMIKACRKPKRESRDSHKQTNKQI